MKSGFTLIEVLIIVVIIGILATFALPQYAKVKERALDNEAKANIVMIQSAEKLFKIESNFFYDSGSSQPTSISNINSNLNLSLPDDAARKWDYFAKKNNLSVSVCVQATRNGDDFRSWSMSDTDNFPVFKACP